MPTLKSLILNNVSSTLSTAYTNASGGNATLKSVTAFYAADGRNVNTATASEWTPFGQPACFVPSTTSTVDAAGNCQFYSIRISADTLINFFTLSYQGSPGGSDVDTQTILCQLLQLQSGKYVAGPVTAIRQVVASMPVFGGIQSISRYNNSPGTTQAGIKAVALSATKVALLVNSANVAPYLYNIGIVGNRITVGAPSVNLATVFSVTQYHMDLERVPGNSDKVLVTGCGASNYSVQAYDIADNSVPTSAGSLFDTGIAIHATTTVGGLGLSLHRRSDPTYLIAGSISNTAISARIFTFNATTNAFTGVSTVTSVASGLTSILGVQCGCVSDSTGSLYNSAVFFIDSVATSNIIAVPQTSGTTIATAQVIASVGSNTKRSIHRVVQWGDQKVFVSLGGGGLCGYNSAGTFTNVLSGTNAQNNHTGHFGPSLFPFDTAPVAYITNSSFFNYVSSWTGGTATSFGTLGNTNVYMPAGISIGKHHTFNERLNCWYVGQGSKVMILSADFTVLGEWLLPRAATSVKHINVSPSGLVSIFPDVLGACYPVNASWIVALIYTAPSSIDTQYCYITRTVPTTTALPVASAMIEQTMFSTSANIFGDAYSYVDFNNVERLIWFVAQNQNSTNTIKYMTEYNLSTLAVTTNSTSSSIAASTNGVPNGLYYHCYFVPIAAPSALNALGLMSAQSSNYTTGASAGSASHAAATGNTGVSPVATNINNLMPNTLNGTNAQQVTVANSSNIKFLSFCNGGGSFTTFWANNGTLRSWQATNFGTQTTASYSYLSAVATASQLVTCLNPLDGVVRSPIVNVAVTSAHTLTASFSVTSAVSGSAQLYRTGTFSWQAFATTLNVVNTSGGVLVPRFTFAVSDGTNDFYPAGSTGPLLTAGSSLRNTDVFYLPAGYSIKIKSSVAAAVDLHLNIVEEN